MSVPAIKACFRLRKSIGSKYDHDFRSTGSLSAWTSFHKHNGFQKRKGNQLIHVSGLMPDNKSSKIVGLGARDADGSCLLVHKRFASG